MKITKEQVQKWNNAMGQGFKTDLNYLMMHNEKCPHMYIKVEGTENQLIEIKLMYQDEYENKPNSYGCSWRVPTGRQIPTAHVCKWIDKGSVMTGYGLGHWIPVGEPQNKKMFSILQKLTHTVNIKELAAVAANDATCDAENKPIF